MTNRQLTVLTGSAAPALGRITDILGTEGVDIRAHCLVDNGDGNCKLRMIVSDPARALQILLERNVAAVVNDVLIDGRKAAGFLSENVTGTHSKEEYCLLGFGINANIEGFPQALETIATSLVQQLGEKIDLEEFSYRLLAKLSWNLGLLYWWEERELKRGTDEDGLEHPLILRWKDLTDSLGRRVVFGFDVMSRPQYRAAVRSIANDGGLILVLEDGTEVIEYSGEIRYLDKA